MSGTPYSRHARPCAALCRASTSLSTPQERRRWPGQARTSPAMTMKKSHRQQICNRISFPGQPCAKAGTQGRRRISRPWIPACAGMTLTVSISSGRYSKHPRNRPYIAQLGRSALNKALTAIRAQKREAPRRGGASLGGRFHRQRLRARLWLGLEATGRLVAAGRRHRRSPPGRAARRILRRTAGVAHDLLAANDALDLIDRQRLELEQPARQRMQLLEMLGQNAARLALAILDDAANLLVDDLGGRVGDVLALRHRMAEEDLLLVLAVAQRSQLVAEAELGDHAARQIGGAADVVGSAGRHLLGAEDELLGDAAAEQARHHRLELHLGLAVFIALGQVHGDAQRAAARDDRHLVQRLVAFGIKHDERVAALVIGGELLLVLG